MTAYPPAFSRASPAPGWLLVGGIVLAALTEAIAGTILSLGRGDIMGDTYATPDEFAWLDVSYQGLKLAGFAFTPWLLSRVSARDSLLAATLTMGVASGLATLTWNLEVLVALRALQGIAGGILLVSGQAILCRDFPRSSQPFLQAMFAMGAVVAPATLAPALQGWLLDSQSWTWIFFAVLPVSLAAAGLVLIGDPAAHPPTKAGPFDGLGLLALCTFLFGATYVLTQGSRWDWFEAGRIRWLCLLLAAGLVGFVIREGRARSNGLFDLSMFKVGDFSFAFAVSFVAGAALFGSAFLIPSFAVSVLSFTPTDAGRLLLPSGALFVGSLLLAAWLMQRRRVPPIATVPLGILLTMAAMWMLSGSSGESGVQDMMPAILLRGLGLGFLFLSITLVAFGRLSAVQLPSAIAAFSIGRQLGGLLGVAGLQTVINHQTGANQAALGAALVPGSPALAERLAAMTSLFIERGLEASAAARAAAAMLRGTVSREATVIAFDTAFQVVALLFVVAAPILIAFRIALARIAIRRNARTAETG